MKLICRVPIGKTEYDVAPRQYREVYSCWALRHQVGMPLSHVDERRRQVVGDDCDDYRGRTRTLESGDGREDRMSRGGRRPTMSNTCDATKLRHLIWVAHVAGNKLISSLARQRRVCYIKPRPSTRWFQMRVCRGTEAIIHGSANDKIAESSRDASYLSVVIFNSTIRRIHNTVNTYFHFRFNAAYK